MNLFYRSTLIREYRCINWLRHMELGQGAFSHYVFPVVGRPEFLKTEPCPVCGIQCLGSKTASRVWTELVQVRGGGFLTEFHSEDIEPLEMEHNHNEHDTSERP